MTTATQKAEQGWALRKPLLELFSLSEFNTYEKDYIELFNTIQGSELGKRVWSELFKHSKEITRSKCESTESESYIVMWLLEGIRNAKMLAEDMESFERLQKKKEHISDSIKHLEHALEQLDRGNVELQEPILFVRHKFDLKLLKENSNNGHKTDKRISPKTSIELLIRTLTSEFHRLENQANLLKSVTSTGGKNARLISFARDLGSHFIGATHLRLSGTVANVINIIFEFERTDKAVDRKWVESILTRYPPTFSLGIFQK